MILYNNKALSEYLGKTRPRVRMVESKPLPSVGGGWSAGYEAGKSFKVNKPLSGNNNKRLK